MISKLALCSVSKSFTQTEGSLLVLDDLSYVFEQGESYAVTGISGTGKSTLLFILSGLEKPTSGHVLFNEHNVTHLAAYNRNFFHRSLSMVFQSAHLMGELTVLENVILKGLHAGLPLKMCTDKGYQLLERVGLKEKAAMLPGTLSGGEQQRVSLIRALFLEPAFLLADEPTAHLDATSKQLVIDLLFEYQKQHTMGLIVSCHDPALASQMKTQLLLSNGKLEDYSAQRNL